MNKFAASALKAWKQLPHAWQEQIARFARIYVFSLLGIWAAQRDITIFSLLACIPAAFDVAYHRWGSPAVATRAAKLSASPEEPEAHA